MQSTGVFCACSAHVKSSPICAMQTCMCNAALCVQCSPACAMQTCMCNADLHVQRSPACTMQPCVCNAGMQNPVTVSRCGLCNSEAGQGTCSLLESVVSPSAGSPLLHAGALPPHSKVARANMASGRRVMGQLTHTMQPAFGSHFKCSIFHTRPPCATTLFFFFSGKISGTTFSQPCRKVRRMVPSCKGSVKEALLGV